MRSRCLLVALAFVLGSCGGAPRVRVPPVRNASAAERETVARALGPSATLLEARALGDPPRLFVLYAHDGDAAEPSAIDARCGETTTPTTVALPTGCRIVSLARWDASATAIDARLALARACGEAAPAPTIEIADLDEDGGAELAIAFDASDVSDMPPLHIVRVLDATTLRVQLAVDVDDDVDDDAEARTAVTFGFDRIESGRGSDLLVMTEPPAPDEPLRVDRWHTTGRSTLRIGPRLEPYTFGDAHDALRRVPYDASADCWRYTP